MLEDVSVVVVVLGGVVLVSVVVVVVLGVVVVVVDGGVIVVPGVALMVVPGVVVDMLVALPRVPASPPLPVPVLLVCAYVNPMALTTAIVAIAEARDLLDFI